MNTTAFRLASASSGRARTLLVLVLAVAGILLGLVAMHSVDLGPSAGSTSAHSHGASEQEHDPAHLTTPAASTMAAPTSLVTGENCTGMCAMECLALGMACAMALLTVAFVLGRRTVNSWMLLPQRLANAVRGLYRLSVAPDPPSLITLSISRT